MKHKTSELEGALLDEAVAKAEGLDLDSLMLSSSGRWLEWDSDHAVWRGWCPSSDWRAAGPIIHRKGIAIWRADGDWCAAVPGDSAYPGDCDYIDVTRRDGSSGPTPLIAAMRAYVASKLGEEVEL